MFKAGETLGDNTVIDRLGEGNFGCVFSSHNTIEGTTVALKVCKLPLGPEDKIRFDLENRILHNLKIHEKVIAPLSGVTEYSPYVYYIMELADCNLETYLNTNYFTLDIEAKINIFKNIAEGLKHAHSKQVVHRDLWWRNVLIKENNNQANIKLNDFGRSKDFTLKLIDSGSQPCWGAIYVQPPEIMFNIWTAADMTNYIIGDMYALGILFFYILEGEPTIYLPEIMGSVKNFARNNSFVNINDKPVTERVSLYEDWLRVIKAQPFQGLRINLVDPLLNDAINLIIKKLCNPDYRQRYQNIEELQVDLNTLNI